MCDWGEDRVEATRHATKRAGIIGDQRKTGNRQVFDAMAKSLHREVVFRCLGWLAHSDYIAPKALGPLINFHVLIAIPAPRQRMEGFEVANDPGSPTCRDDLGNNIIIASEVYSEKTGREPQAMSHEV